MDDLSYLTSINLKKELIGNPDMNPVRPVTYHNRTGQILPTEVNVLQDQMNKLNIFTEENEMQINVKKTKVMLFNTSKKNDFQPEIVGENGEILDIEDEFKLLGVKITSNLRWDANTQYICAKAYSRLWMLRNLKKYGASIEDLLDVYEKQCRSVLEMAVPAWSPGLTKSNGYQIERVQKTAFAIILGDAYTSYSRALSRLNMETLTDRRTALCLGFAKKAFKSDKFNHWFCDSESSGLDIQLDDVKTKTKRYRRLPLPYLTALLNDEFSR